MAAAGAAAPAMCALRVGTGAIRASAAATLASVVPECTRSKATEGESGRASGRRRRISPERDAEESETSVDAFFHCAIGQRREDLCRDSQVASTFANGPICLGNVSVCVCGRVEGHGTPCPCERALCVHWKTGPNGGIGM